MIGQWDTYNVKKLHQYYEKTLEVMMLSNEALP